MPAGVRSIGVFTAVITTCLLLLLSALFVGVAAAQTLSGPTTDGHHLQPTQQQADSRENDGARRRDRAIQSEIDRLCDEIMRAAARGR
jgi:hypothetical protein